MGIRLGDPITQQATPRVRLGDPMPAKTGMGGTSVVAKGSDAEAVNMPPELVAALQRTEQLAEQFTAQKRKNIQERHNPMSAARLAAGEAIADSVMATPSIAADFLSYPVRKGYTAATEGLEAAQDVPWLGATPRLTTEKMTGWLGGEEALENRRMIRDEIHPWATTAGGIAGDIATLVAGKAPLAKTMERFETGMKANIKKAEQRKETLEKAKEAGTMTAKKAQLGRLRHKPIAKRFQRWGVRGMEAGAEGAALAILKEGDPESTAMYTGGIQMGNNLIEGALKHTLFKPGMNKLLSGPAKFAAQAAVLGTLIQAGSNIVSTEEGELRDYEAREKAIEKGIKAYAAGIASALMGGRTQGGAWATRNRQLAQAVTSMPRHTLTSVIAEWQKLSPEERAAAAPKIEEFSSGMTQPASRATLKAWDAATKKGGKAILDFIMEQ